MDISPGSLTQLRWLCEGAGDYGQTLAREMLFEGCVCDSRGRSGCCRISTTLLVSVFGFLIFQLQSHGWGWERHQHQG